VNAADLARLELAKRAYQATQPSESELQTGVRRARLALIRTKPRRNWFSRGLVFVVLAVGGLAYAKPHQIGELLDQVLPSLNDGGKREEQGGVSSATDAAAKVRASKALGQPLLMAPAGEARAAEPAALARVDERDHAMTPAATLASADETRAALPRAARALAGTGTEAVGTEAEGTEAQRTEERRAEAAGAAAGLPNAATHGVMRAKKASPKLASAPREPSRPTADALPRPPAASDWGRVGQALAQGNDAAALAALSELSESDDARTRDKADLGRAQLLLAHGNADQACALARALTHRRAGGRIERQALSILKACTH
jgi:hypothetical protein